MIMNVILITDDELRGAGENRLEKQWKMSRGRERFYSIFLLKWRLQHWPRGS